MSESDEDPAEDENGGLPPDEVMPKDTESAPRLSIAEAAIRAAMGDAELVATGTSLTVGDINQDYAVVLVGGDSKVLRELEIDDAQATDRMELLSKTAFELWMRPHQTVVKYRETSKLVPSASIWLSSPARRQYRGIEFAPAPPGEDRGRDGFYNLWGGFAVEPDEAGAARCPKFLRHIMENVCQDDTDLYDWVLTFFAQMVQQPERKPGVCLVLRGKEGSGKTKIGQIMGRLFPPHYILADQPRYVSGQFNAHLASCLLLQADEAFWAGDKDAEGRIKGLITGDIQMIERKGIDPIKMRNHVRMMMTTNNDWAVPAGLESRRFAVLDVGDDHLQDRPYFAAIDREMLEEGGLAGLLHHLMTWPLDTVELGDVPQTEALFEQKVRGMPPEEAWWFHRLQEGAVTAGREDWPAEIPKAELQNDYFAYAERIGVKRKADPVSLGIKLKTMAPGMGAARRMWDVDDEFGKDRRRVWFYTLPTLEVCRTAFAARMRTTVDWGTEQ